MRTREQECTATEIAELVPILRRFARTFAHDPNDADDLVQETLVKALSKIDQYQPGTHLKSWLFTIMRNTFLTRLKLSRRECPGLDCQLLASAVMPRQEWHVLGRQLEEAFGRISQEGQEVITLVVFEGMAYEQVATRLGCAIGTIKSRLNRARRKLATEMDAPTKAEGTSSVPRLRSGLKFDWMIDV